MRTEGNSQTDLEKAGTYAVVVKGLHKTIVGMNVVVIWGF